MKFVEAKCIVYLDCIKQFLINDEWVGMEGDNELLRRTNVKNISVYIQQKKK